MKILAVDIGTGTQDILLFDSEKAVENSVQMVMPAPTVIAAKRVRNATTSLLPLILTGTNMGGGPVTEAVLEHLGAGLPVYGTAAAVVTFDDDPAVIRDMGIEIISEDEAIRLRGSHVVLQDLDLDMVRRAVSEFQVIPDWDILAVAVFDHGNAPPKYSDRKFRFDYLRQHLFDGRSDVMSFVHLSSEVPYYLTRMLAVVETVAGETPLLLTDTAQAAILGSLEDSHVMAQQCKVVVNLGNEHTLAYHLHGGTILGMFEHHTHMLSKENLEGHLRRLADGTLDGDQIWREQGHGGIVVDGRESLGFVSAIGPMRGILLGSPVDPYWAAPHGSMMLAGPFGLVRACSEKFPEYREQILKSLGTVGEGLGHSH
jgi:uncharacterized protein (DUF1786 family)